MEQAALRVLFLVAEELGLRLFEQELKVSRARPWVCSPAEHGAMKLERVYWAQYHLRVLNETVHRFYQSAVHCGHLLRFGAGSAVPDLGSPAGAVMVGLWCLPGSTAAPVAYAYCCCREPSQRKRVE